MLFSLVSQKAKEFLNCLLLLFQYCDLFCVVGSVEPIYKCIPIFRNGNE